MDINSSRQIRLWAQLMQIGAYTGCHQRADRSFSIGGYQMPLCARCTGLFAGQVAAIILFTLTASLASKPLFLLAGLSVLLLGIDGTGQLMGYWESKNPRRFATGIFCGFFTMSCLLRLIAAFLGF